MKLLTNLQYDAICEIVIGLQKENEELKKQIAFLERQNQFLTGLMKVEDNTQIDYPNSHRKENDTSSWV
ncbi:MAG: hypothetical protein J6S67_11370 [Methanobrevibacter sp.]|nr:hypothetical protein [Methanobrevibacter sp.]